MILKLRCWGCDCIERLLLLYPLRCLFNNLIPFNSIQFVNNKQLLLPQVHSCINVTVYKWEARPSRATSTLYLLPPATLKKFEKTFNFVFHFILLKKSGKCVFKIACLLMEMFSEVTFPWRKSVYCPFSPDLTWKLCPISVSPNCFNLFLYKLIKRQCFLPKFFTFFTVGCPWLNVGKISGQNGFFGQQKLTAQWVKWVLMEKINKNRY